MRPLSSREEAKRHLTQGYSSRMKEGRRLRSCSALLGDGRRRVELLLLHALAFLCLSEQALPVLKKRKGRPGTFAPHGYVRQAQRDCGSSHVRAHRQGNASYLAPSS